MEVMIEITKKLASIRAAKKERLIRESIINVIGKDDFNIQDVLPRLHRQINPDCSETFLFDGQPLIYFHPQSETVFEENESLSANVKSSQEDRYLFKYNPVR